MHDSLQNDDNSHEFDIYIVELTQGGHRITFLKYLITRAQSLGLSVCVLTLPQTADSGSFDELNVDLKKIDIIHRFQWVPIGFVAGIISQIEIYFSIKKYLKLVKPIRGVVFATLQAAGGIPLGMFGRGYPHKWTGVVMAPAAHLRSYSIDSHHKTLELLLQKYAYSNMVRHENCCRISSFDPLFVDWFQSEKVVSCPDPVEIFDCYSNIGDEFKRINAEDRILIVVAGTIDKRKQIPKLARVLMSLPNNPYYLLIAGKLKKSDELEGQEIKQLIDDDKACVVARRLTDEEVDYCFFVADIVWSGNSRTYGSSGAVVRGAVHSKPVITMKGSVMGRVLESEKGGPVADMSSELELKDTLITLQSVRARRDIGEINARVFSNNDVEMYTSAVLDPLLHDE